MLPTRVLVVRNDKLGDCVLALPSLALLAQALPEARIDVLVSAYTREIAEASPAVHHVVVDPGEEAGLGELARVVREGEYDALLALWTTTRVGMAGWLARIPYRLARATKVAQVLFNKREIQHRSKERRPEYLYNLELARRLLSDNGVEAPENPAPPFLRVEAGRVAELERSFRARHGFEPGTRLVFVHPGAGGSSANLSLDRYAALCQALRSEGGHAIVVSAGPEELDLATELAQLVARGEPDLPCVVHHSQEGLLRFAEHASFADVFVGGSTGALHVAGALDTPTATFYSGLRSATAGRWVTLNTPERRLAWSGEEGDLSGIDLASAAAEISTRFLGAGV